MATFNYEFEELPLVVAPGIEAALINGCAEIEYTCSADWQIKSVAVEGYRHISQAERDAGQKPWVYIPASSALEFIILGRLNNEWAGKVRDAVSDQIEADHESAADVAADYRRDSMREAV